MTVSELIEILYGFNKNSYVVIIGDVGTTILSKEDIYVADSKTGRPGTVVISVNSSLKSANSYNSSKGKK